MLSAAKGLAMTAVDLLTDPETLRRAKEQHAADVAEANRGRRD